MLVSLALANSTWSLAYRQSWEMAVGGESLSFWINDALMAVFFLYVGLEIRYELVDGELRQWRTSLLPVLGAIGGMVVPALIYIGFNAGLPSLRGVGIPMATDIAFSLGVLSLVRGAPPSFRLFLAALAIIDDLGAILVIAIFYSGSLGGTYLLLALGVVLVLVALNRLGVRSLWPYLLGGGVLWYFIHHSGIHATLAGVILAFLIPRQPAGQSLSDQLLHGLHLPVTFFILPLFALANTAIELPPSVVHDLASPAALGIMVGLIIGKPLGIAGMATMGVRLGWCSLPAGMTLGHIVRVGILAGIGFTMSIFISLLAFDDHEHIIISKLAILTASLAAGAVGFFALRSAVKKPDN